MKTDDSALLTTHDVAKLVGVDSTRVSHYVRQGKLAPASRVMGQNRSGFGFTHSAVESFITSRARDAAQPQASKAGEEQLVKEMGERVLNRFGIDALDKSYEPNVLWSYKPAKPKSPGTHTTGQPTAWYSYGEPPQVYPLNP